MFSLGSSCHGSVVKKPTSIHEDVSLIPGFAWWVKGPAFPWALVYVGHRHGSERTLLCWYRPAAAAPIRPIAWELPYHMPWVWPLKKAKKKKMFPGFCIFFSAAPVAYTNSQGKGLNQSHSCSNCGNARSLNFCATVPIPCSNMFNGQRHTVSNKGTWQTIGFNYEATQIVWNFFLEKLAWSDPGALSP